jgi:hypothetical protein
LIYGLLDFTGVLQVALDPTGLLGVVFALATATGDAIPLPVRSPYLLYCLDDRAHRRHTILSLHITSRNNRKENLRYQTQSIILRNNHKSNQVHKDPTCLAGKYQARDGKRNPGGVQRQLHLDDVFIVI